MFEKEANLFASIMPWNEEEDDWETIAERAYLKGAEFGYNKANEELEEKYKETICNSEMNLNSVTERLEELEKANEWHYVKDGDLPKEEGEYLCAFDFHKRYALDIEFIFINNEGKHYFDNLAWDINKLVAWKEIVFPKESE